MGSGAARHRPAAIASRSLERIASGPLPDAAEPTAEELRRYFYAFADDSMRGRESGTIDEHRAAAFLADRLKALGLEPAGDSGFFQRVPLSRTARGPQTSVVVTRPDGSTRTLAVGPEVAPASSLGPGSPPSKRFADAELVLAQDGITNLKMGRDDLAGLDLKGKIVVMVFASEAAGGALVPTGWPARATTQFPSDTRLRLRVVSTRTQMTDSPEEMMKVTNRNTVRGHRRVGWHSCTMTANHRSGRNSCTASWVRYPEAWLLHVDFVDVSAAVPPSSTREAAHDRRQCPPSPDP